MKVEAFQPSTLPNWWVMKVEHNPGSYLVSNNVIGERLGGKPLARGEEVTFSASKTLTYPNTDFKFVIELRRAPKASIMED